MRTKALLIVSVLGLASVVAPSTHARLIAQSQQMFIGTITDDMCANKDGHATMRMGPTDAECTKACVAAHGAEYVLTDGTQVYTLSDQKTPEQFAGHRVRLAGTLDAKTKKIQVQSISAAK